MILNTETFTPVLIAMVSNKFKIVRYFLEELKLSLSLFLYKPREQAELQIEDYIIKNPNNLRDVKRDKKK